MVGQLINSEPGANDVAVQRIARLTPLASVIERIDALVAPVAPCEVAVAHAVGRVLAEGASAGTHPSVPIALRDGWAVQSSLTEDASAYAPVLIPSAMRVDVGAPLPTGADAVADHEAVEVREGKTYAITTVTSGDGVLAPGADMDRAGAVLAQGSYVSAVAAAALAAVGVARLSVREPRVRIVCARGQADPIIAAATAVVARGIAAAGGTLFDQTNFASLEQALEAPGVDATIAIGGTGSGRNDQSVATLARLGRVEAHGIALSPGETSALGFIGPRPVLLLPGRLDAALAAWLTVGQHLLARLSVGRIEPRGMPVRLARKVASQLGLAELIPVALRNGEAWPLAARYLPLRTLACADGFIIVPADREGYPEGTSVMVRLLP